MSGGDHLSFYSLVAKRCGKSNSKEARLRIMSRLNRQFIYSKKESKYISSDDDVINHQRAKIPKQKEGYKRRHMHKHNA